MSQRQGKEQKFLTICVGNGMEDITFDVYNKRDLLSHVEVKNNEVSVINYTDSKLFTPFLIDNVNAGTVMTFFTNRWIEKTRPDFNERLSELGLDEYDPIEVVKLTHGLRFEDYTWIKFDGEDITYEELFDEYSIELGN